MEYMHVAIKIKYLSILFLHAFKCKIYKIPKEIQIKVKLPFLNKTDNE